MKMSTYRNSEVTKQIEPAVAEQGFKEVAAELDIYKIYYHI